MVSSSSEFLCLTDGWKLPCLLRPFCRLLLPVVVCPPLRLSVLMPELFKDMDLELNSDGPPERGSVRVNENESDGAWTYCGSIVPRPVPFSMVESTAVEELSPPILPLCVVRWCCCCSADSGVFDGVISPDELIPLLGLDPEILFIVRSVPPSVLMRQIEIS